MEQRHWFDGQEWTAEMDKVDMANLHSDQNDHYQTPYTFNRGHSRLSLERLNAFRAGSIDREQDGWHSLVRH